jgi:hypothetical protein
VGLLFAGVATGLAGALAFATVHAIVIVPIWTRMLNGVPVAILTGIAITWAMDETAAARGPLSRADAGRFGSALWLTLALATIFENALRLAAWRIPESLGVAAAVCLAVVSGTCVGWLLTRRRTGIIAWAGASLALTLAMGGPIPVVNAARAAWLYAAFLPMCAGAVLVSVVARRAWAGRAHRPAPT